MLFRSSKYIKLKTWLFALGKYKIYEFTLSLMFFCHVAIKIIKLCNRDRDILRVNLFQTHCIKSFPLKIFKVDTNLRRLLEKEAMGMLPRLKERRTQLMLLSRRSLTYFIVFQRLEEFSDKQSCSRLANIQILFN